MVNIFNSLNGGSVSSSNLTCIWLAGLDILCSFWSKSVIWQLQYALHTFRDRGSTDETSTACVPSAGRCVPAAGSKPASGHLESGEGESFYIRS